MTPSPDPGLVRELFDAVVDLAPEDRRRHLDERCPDPRLRHRVERLLAAATSGCGPTPSDAVPSPDSEGPPDLPGLEPVGRLGAGGMGVVWRYRDVQFQRPVAVKVLRPGVRVDPAIVRRFDAEARITGQLAHPAIVPVHAMGRLPDGRPYYTMKLVEGETLAALLRGRPDPASRRAELVQVFDRVCQAVAYAHDHGVIHRDLKPANVMVGAFGEVQVMDWGLAKLLPEGGTPPADPDADDRASGRSAAEAGDRTSPGSVLGTWAYMPPEQARGRVAEVDRRSDVFGLGGILCELLTGRPPYTDPDPASVLLQATEAELGPAVARLRGCGADPELIRIAERCLAPDKADRPADAGEVAESVGAYLSGVQERLQQERLARERQKLQATEERRRRKLWAGLTAAVAVALAVTGVFLAYQHRAARELQTSLTESRRLAANASWDHGHQLCEQGEVGHGLLVLAHALRAAPEGQEDADLRDAIRTDLSAWHGRCHILCQVWPHPAPVASMAASPDRKTVVTGCADGKVRLWDLPSGRCRTELVAHPGGVSAVGFGPTGEAFITGGADGTVIVWDAGSGRPLKTLVGHAGKVCAVALAPDGRLALSGGADRTARLWAVESAACLAAVEHPGSVRTVAFRPDGHAFVTGGDGPPNETGGVTGEVRLYDTRTAHPGEPVVLRKGSGEGFDEPVCAAAFSPAGDTLLVGDADWEVTFWDVDSRRQFAATSAGNGEVVGVAFSPDGRTALTGARDSGVAHLWDVADLRVRWARLGKGVLRPDLDPGPLNPPLRHPSPVTAVTICDDHHFLTAENDGYVRVWRKAPGPSVTVLRHSPDGPRRAAPRFEYVVEAVAFHPSGRLAATAGRDGKLRLWDVSAGREDGPPLCHEGRLRHVAFTPDGRTVLTAGADGRVRFWDLETRREYGRPLEHPAEVTSVSVDPGGRRILTACKDGAARVWDAGTREPIGDPLPHAGPGQGIATAVSPDGERLLTGGDDGTTKLWDRGGRLLRTFGSRTGFARLAFSPDGARLVTANRDRTARVWDTATGDLLATLLHRADVNAAVFTPDGRRVVTGSRDGAHLWDVRSRRPVGPTVRYADDVLHVAVSPDGGPLALLADWDGYGVLWRLPEPVTGDPGRVTCRVESAAGMRLDESGGLQLLDGRSWLDLQE